MRNIISRAIAAALIGAVTLSALPAGAASVAAAKPATASKAAGVTNVAETTTDFSARRRHYRGYRGGNPAAAIAAFGLIAGAIAASQRPSYGYYGYGYGPPAYYGGYGYGYGYPRPYYRSYRYW